MTRLLAVLAIFCLLGCGAPARTTSSSRESESRAAPLASWNDGVAKSALTSFVSRVTTEGSPDFVPAPDRIAVFDNDGTLWAEQPVYFQLQFALDCVKAMAGSHPDWKTKKPFSYLVAGDVKGFLAGREQALTTVMAASHSGITTEEFASVVKDWLRTAKHPKSGRPYTDMVYQPMLELLDYLRANGFKTFIVSGGGVEFMRASPRSSSSTTGRESRPASRR